MPLVGARWHEFAAFISMCAMHNSRCFSGPLRSHTHPPKALRGFTLIEVLVVIGIMGILAALAGPSFLPIIERWRAKQVFENMTSTIYLARSEAIKRGGNVTVLKNTLTPECPQEVAARDWSCGWVVFADSNNDGVLQSTEDILQTVPAVTGVTVSKSSDPLHFQLNRWGQINITDGDDPLFTFSPVGSSDASQSSKFLCVRSSGHIHEKKGSTC